MDSVFYIVETEDNTYLGLLEFVNGGLIIRNGFRGHPKHVKAEDIVQMFPAEMSPLVETVDYAQAV